MLENIVFWDEITHVTKSNDFHFRKISTQITRNEMLVDIRFKTQIECNLDYH